MPYRHYEWATDGALPKLEHHSRVKHEILGAYLSAYVQTLLSNPNKPELKLTLVDGFCGGGLYALADTGTEMPGSPLVMLDAMQEAEALANLKRTKPIRFDVDYFFIDTERAAVDQLQKALIARGYAGRLNTSVHVWQADFNTRATELIEHVNRRMPRSGRAIFLLDQYGYSEVPTETIRSIMTRIPAAEVILTFNVASLLTYITDKDGRAETLLTSAGVPGSLRGRSIEDIKLSQSDWRLFIQACLYPDLIRRCGALFYTLFFIRSEEGHGDYWFIHLSQHARARDVMTRIHWDKGNFFIHYGGAGLNMFEGLGYTPSLDSKVSQQSALGFGFGDSEREASVAALMEQIPSLVYSAPDEGLVFDAMFATHCNLSPAHAEIHKDAIARLRDLHEVEVVSAATRRVTSGRIQGGDLVRRPRQQSIKFVR